MVATAGFLAVSYGAQAQTSGTIAFSSLSTTTSTTKTLGSTGYTLVFPADSTTLLGTGSACDYVASGSGQSCSGISLAWSVTTGTGTSTLTLTFTASGNFGLLAGFAATTPPTNAELRLNFQVDAPVTTRIHSASLGLRGSNHQNHTGTMSPSNTYATEYLCTTASNPCEGSGGYFHNFNSTSVADAAGSASATYDLLAANQAVRKLNVSKDIFALANSSNGNSGYNVTSISQIFQAPEPVSVSLLGVGFAGAAAARRWRRRDGRRAAGRGKPRGYFAGRSAVSGGAA